MTDSTALGSAKPSYAMRKQPRQQRAAATVDAILEAAARILVETSYATASTNRIAEHAGVGIGSLYEYFPGKEAIFAELRRREMTNWYGKLRAGPRSGAPRAVIRHIVTTQIQYAAANPELYVALETEVPRAAVSDVQGAIQDDFLQLSTAYLEAHRHLLRPKPRISFVAEFLARWVSSTVHGFAMHAPKELLRRDLAEELVEAVARYLLKDACHGTTSTANRASAGPSRNRRSYSD